MKKIYFLKIFVFISLFLSFESLTFGQTGNVYAISLDGAESFGVNDDASNNLDLTGSYTFECWLNVDVYQSLDRIFDRRTVCAMSIIAANGTGDFAIRFTERDASHNIQRTLETSAAFDMDLDTWYHVAVTYDATSHEAKLYINGDLAASENNSLWALTASTNALNIGGLYNSGYSNQINAHIDEVRVSNIARNISDMQTDYSREEYSTDANTVLLMHLDDQGSSPTYLSGTGLTGTTFNDGITTIDYTAIRIGSPAFLLRPNYQSRATGNWGDASTWNYYKDGTTWSAATLVPDIYTPEVEIQGGYDVTLTGAVSLRGTLTLTDGIINTTSADLLTFATLANDVSGGNNTSYIDGPMAKVGIGDFIFPCGDGGKYAPVELSNISASETYTVEYHKEAYNNTSSLTSPLTDVSNSEWWQVDRAGSASADVTLYWYDSKWSGLGNISDLRIAHYSSTTSKWEAETGTYTSTGNVSLTTSESGTMTVTSVSSFSPFTFGTINSTTNTLPIELISFNLSKTEKNVQLNWATASELNNSGFEIQRSNDDKEWETLGFINGAGNSNNIIHYSYIDESPLMANYYRLKQIDYDGSFEYSSIKYIDFSGRNNISVFPNPTAKSINISGIATDMVLQIFLFDFTGRLINTYNPNTSKIDMNEYKNGIYYLRIQYLNGEEKSVSFIKH